MREDMAVVEVTEQDAVREDMAVVEVTWQAVVEVTSRS